MNLVPINDLKCHFQKPGKYVVEGAIVDFDEVLSDMHAIVNCELRFDGCTIRGSDGSGFRGTRFAKDIAFRYCKFDHDFRLENCAFDERLTLEASQIHGQFNIERCCFRSAPPRLSRIHAYEKVSILGFMDRWDASRLQFDWCRFHGGLEIEMPPFEVQFHLYNCVFGQGARSKITWAQRQVDSKHVVQFNTCLIAGRVVLADENAADATRVAVQLVDSAISGEINLERLHLCEIDVSGTSFSTGGIALSYEQLSPMAVRKWRRFLPPMNPSILAAERAFLAAKASDKFGKSELAEEVARQCGELRNAFQQMPQCGEHERFCHFKFKDYSRQAKELLVGRSTLRSLWLFGFIAIFSLIAFPILLLNQAFVLAAFAALLPIAFFGRIADGWGQTRGVSLRGIAWDLFVEKWAGGYLVYLRSVLLTGLLLILFFAVANSVIVGVFHTHCSEPQHDILRGDNTSIWPDKFESGSDVAEFSVRMFYYSTVTFTTLGYGDFAPRGWLLQLLSAAEALTGAVTISLITVVLARKIVR